MVTLPMMMMTMMMMMRPLTMTDHRGLTLPPAGLSTVFAALRNFTWTFSSLGFFHGCAGMLWCEVVRRKREMKFNIKKLQTAFLA